MTLNTCTYADWMENRLRAGHVSLHSLPLHLPRSRFLLGGFSLPSIFPMSRFWRHTNQCFGVWHQTDYPTVRNTESDTRFCYLLTWRFHNGAISTKADRKCNIFYNYDHSVYTGAACACQQPLFHPALILRGGEAVAKKWRRSCKNLTRPPSFLPSPSLIRVSEQTKGSSIYDVCTILRFPPLC